MDDRPAGSADQFLSSDEQNLIIGDCREVMGGTRVFTREWRVVIGEWRAFKREW
jgi:hypothetical protein